MSAVFDAMNLLGRRESDGLLVCLFWNQSDPENEFGVTVRDNRTDSDFILYPETRADAVFAYLHPFVAQTRAMHGKRAMPV